MLCRTICISDCRAIQKAGENASRIDTAGVHVLLPEMDCSFRQNAVDANKKFIVGANPLFGIDYQHLFDKLRSGWTASRNMLR